MDEVKESLTVAIERCTECGSHSYQTNTLVSAHTLPDADVVLLGSHQGRATLDIRRRDILGGGGGVLDHLALRFSLRLRHSDDIINRVGFGIACRRFAGRSGVFMKRYLPLLGWGEEDNTSKRREVRRKLTLGSMGSYISFALH